MRGKENDSMSEAPLKNNMQQTVRNPRLMNGWIL